MFTVNRYSGGSFEYIVPDGSAFAGARFTGDYNLNLVTNTINNFSINCEYNSTSDIGEVMWINANIDANDNISVNNVPLKVFPEFITLIKEVITEVKSGNFIDKAVDENTDNTTDSEEAEKSMEEKIESDEATITE